MKILICYASTEGQTRKIARFCSDQLFALGHSVEVLPVADADPIDLAQFDAAILAGSVHLGKVQEVLAGFARTHAEALNGMPSLFLQVSLAAAGQDAEELAALDRIAHEFTHKTEWRPGAIHQVAGAFRFTEYDFFKSWAMRYIAAQKNQTVDPHADTEYTDWAALTQVLKSWAAGIGKG
jgi:menaquinone-dependent protoporphyrinogen oxidase